ncbi:MAG TPA: type II toxin-antitoxin system VapC family toxin [Thermoanaerobaculia bacterium]|nr:type II toxin-antitoxin system VapC family toxin [Thermoanaerobaculia bacterium]
MIVIDTSALIDSLCGTRRSAARLREHIMEGDRVVLPSIVLYEWLRGPRTAEELRTQEDLFPAAQAVPFAAAEALIAANLYGKVPTPRGREVDLAIAAVAIARDAQLWTLNEVDFRDIPGLHLAGRTGR